MGIRFTDLPFIGSDTVPGDSIFAVLDGNDHLVKQTPANHASHNRTFGIGSSQLFGHTKISDDYTDATKDESNGWSASPKAVNSAFSLCLTAWVGTQSEWEGLTNSQKNKYTIINFTDV